MLRFAAKFDAEVRCAFKVSDCVFGRFNVPRGTFGIVLTENIGYCGNVWLGLSGEPVHAANKLLKLFIEFVTVLLWHFDVGDGVHWVAASVVVDVSVWG